MLLGLKMQYYYLNKIIEYIHKHKFPDKFRKVTSHLPISRLYNDKSSNSLLRKSERWVTIDSRTSVRWLRKSSDCVLLSIPKNCLPYLPLQIIVIHSTFVKNSGPLWTPYSNVTKYQTKINILFLQKVENFDSSANQRFNCSFRASQRAY